MGEWGTSNVNELKSIVSGRFRCPQVTASCLVGVDIHTMQVVEGEGIAEASAVAIHTSIHRAMEKTVDCVMHAHPPYSTALSEFWAGID